jgi:capsular exopolysaccharide synthesis family protein
MTQRSAEAEDANAANKRRIAQLMPDSFVAEQFRTLRARLDSLAAQRPIKSIAMTSALSGEGKTTSAVNLALVSSLGVERRILLVDCDLRKPKIHRALGLRPEAGLAEVLLGQATLDKAIVRVEGTQLDVLPVRAMPPNPSELLSSPAMRTLMEQLVQRYDLVLLDTPAMLALPDAKTLSEMTDGIVMIVRADVTPQDDVNTALDILDRRRVLGLVLNGATVDEHYYGY